MEKVAGEQDIFHRYLLNFSKFKRRINLLLNASGLKLGYYGIFDMLFPFLAFF